MGERVNCGTVFESILQKAETGGTLARDDIVRLLGAASPEQRGALHAAAYRVKEHHVGRRVRLRGLVEISNACRKNCLYCGIRRDNGNVARYRLAQEEILGLADAARRFRYGSIALQAGERQDAEWTGFIEDTVRRIKAQPGAGLGITLSLGEQTRETYRRWFEAGAHRYLLRIEMTQPEIYARFHPADHSWQGRVACLGELRAAGYQVGTGVMCGLPGQSLENLAGDLLFFKERDIDMVGMGPWLRHAGTPLGRAHPQPQDAEGVLGLALNMIAVARLLLRDVNIVASTALQTLAPDGRERGLLAGANVIMPNLTPAAYRAGYTLYDGKPACDEQAGGARRRLEAAIRAAGETPAHDEWGDAPHFANRQPIFLTNPKGNTP